MKTEDLKGKGLTDEQIAFVMAENGKDIQKFKKDNEALTAERDNLKERAEAAEETLKKFDGVDPEAMTAEVEKWKATAKAAEDDYNAKIAQRDFDDALKEEIGSYKFTSEAAKRAIMGEIKEAGLKVKNGKILGLSDLMEQIKGNDASAFVDESAAAAEANKAQFTRPLNQQGSGGGKMTREQIDSIKDKGERQRAIAENIALYQ